jgi:hypothetical protein
MTNLPINATLLSNISTYDTQGAILYILIVIIWYAIGFGLILLNDIGPRPDHVKLHRNTNVYQAVNDLHEQKARNDILVELKDQDRRKKLWDIYYGKEKNRPLRIEKDKQIVVLIIKQLHELNEQRRLLRNNLNEISLDQTDDDETESNRNIQ